MCGYELYDFFLETGSEWAMVVIFSLFREEIE